jgi:hypothetical protein
MKVRVFVIGAVDDADEYIKNLRSENHVVPSEIFGKLDALLFCDGDYRYSYFDNDAYNELKKEYGVGNYKGSGK